MTVTGFATGTVDANENIQARTRKEKDFQTPSCSR